MKKLIILIIAIAFASCDKVKNPVIERKCDFKNVHIADSNTSVINTRKILIQDYTGHTCGNCPRAAEDLETIITANPGKVIGMAIHAGTQFSPPKLPDFPEDFRTTAGTQWDTYFAMSQNGLPKGSVNWAQTPYYQSRSTWSNHAATQLAMAQKAKLFLKVSLDTTTLSVRTDVKVTMLASTNYDVKLVVVITEDSIIARQKDYSVNPDEIPNYVFMHVMRGDLKGTWGEILKPGPVASGAELTNVSCGNVYPWGGQKKKLKDMSAVAILYAQDASSGKIMEVLQVEKLHLKK